MRASPEKLDMTVVALDSSHPVETRPDADATRTQVIRVAGNVRDTVVIRRLDEVATRYVQPGRRRVVLDLEAVEEADTRLVAELVTIIRRAMKAGVVWQVRASERLRHWIALYKLDRLLLPDGEPLGDRAVSEPPAVEGPRP